MVYDPPAIYGIIGNPVKHSLSPYMHNAAFKSLKVNARYELFPLTDSADLKIFMTDLKEKENPIFGLNITVPFKEEVVPYVDTLDHLAQRMGAVNTLLMNHERRIMGFNTDGPGFLTHLLELGFNPKEKRIAILGAGGTTRALLAVLCLLQDRPVQIKLYNRTKKNATDLVEGISSRIDTSIIEIVDHPDDLDIELADLLINTTTNGMSPDDVLLINENNLHANLLVYDCIYAPVETKLLLAAKKMGAKTANGLGMLLYQGVLAFQHWADCQVDEKLRKIMQKALEDKAYGS